MFYIEIYKDFIFKRTYFAFFIAIFHVTITRTVPALSYKKDN